MRPSSQAILESLDDPERLEMMYRQDPASFRDAFAEASRIAPDSTAVRTWRARLDYNTPALGANRRRLALALGIGLIVGALIRLPAVWLGDEWYYPRLAPPWSFYHWRHISGCCSGNAGGSLSGWHSALSPRPGR